MSKGADVKVQVGSESVLRNGGNEGTREEKWMSVGAEKGLQERLSMGTLSLLSPLTRIRFLSTDMDRYAPATLGHCTLQLSHRLLSSFLFHSPLPIQHDQYRVPYSGIIFFSASPSQAQLGCLPVPLSSTTQPSCQLNINVDTLSLKFT